MMTSFLLLSLSAGFVFRFLCCSSIDSHSAVPPADDPGAQSGHETQFVFSEGDVRQRDGDDLHLRAAGKFFFSQIH